MTNSITPERVETWHAELAGASTEQLLRWAGEAFAPRISLATAMGLEAQVLIDLIVRLQLPISVFTIDTGRLFPETYELLQRTMDHYGISIRVFYPRTSLLEQMVAEEGIALYRRSVTARKRCCWVRKVEPLQRALKDLDGWICGLRREQAVTRANLQVIEWDRINERLKLNPLADWSEAEVWEYLETHSVPYNPLHRRGFPSIGCACCTRAIRPGEDPRAGRWWWEQTEQKECGLHLRDARSTFKA